MTRGGGRCWPTPAAWLSEATTSYWDAEAPETPVAESDRPVADYSEQLQRNKVSDNTRVWDAERMEADLLERLQTLEWRLAPDGLADRIRIYVLTPAAGTADIRRPISGEIQTSHCRCS